MKAERLQAPKGRTRWRKPAIIAAVAAVHVGLLTWLGVATYRLDTVTFVEEPQVIDIQLEARPLLPGERLRQPRVPPKRASEPQRRQNQTALPQTQADLPSPPRPRPAASAPGAPAPAGPTVDDTWRVRPGGPDNRASAGLRTSMVGCTHRDQLTQAEQDACDQRRADIARAAAPIRGTGNPARDAQFEREGEAALAQYNARRRPLAGGTGNAGPADCVGSNFGTGCAGAHLDPSLQPYATGPIRGRRDGRVASDAPAVPGVSSPRD